MLTYWCLEAPTICQVVVYASQAFFAAYKTCHAVPPRSSTFRFKWLFVYLFRHSLEAFSVCSDSAVFLDSSCSFAATSSRLFHKCIQDIILAAVYYSILHVNTGQMQLHSCGQMQLRSGGQIWLCSGQNGQSLVKSNNKEGPILTPKIYHLFISLKYPCTSIINKKNILCPLLSLGPLFCVLHKLIMGIICSFQDIPR